jgi:hypothetical protein
MTIQANAARWSSARKTCTAKPPPSTSTMPATAFESCPDPRGSAPDFASFDVGALLHSAHVPPHVPE